MATYNCAATLPDALRSIEEQTYANWELVVCDDASTDDTASLLREFAHRRQGQVTMLQNERNSKLPYSLNRCLAVAEGELIARMDGDDISRPTRLEQQVAFLQHDPECAVVGTAMQRFDDGGLRDIITMPIAPTRLNMRKGVPFGHATVMVRAQVYHALDGYTVSPRTVRGQDVDLWFRFFNAGFAGANLPDPLYLVREDLDAIRRRTLRTRFNSYRTALLGYKLLGFPVSWYWIPTLQFLKALVPATIALRFRVWQARHALPGRPN